MLVAATADPLAFARSLLARLRRRRGAAVRRRYTSLALRTVAQAGPGLHINGPCHLTAATYLGSNVHMNGLEIAGGGTVRIGSNFHSGPGCLLITQNHNYDHGEAIPYDATVVNKEITIADNVWLGSRVIVLGGVTIGDGAIIQAGSVVVSDIPRCAIAGGHPAKVFGQRDIEHYERLVAAGKFH